MIRINSKPHKKAEYFKGTITMYLPHSENTEWNFTLIRTTNGTTEDEVESDRAQFEKEFEGTDRAEVSRLQVIVEETVLANVKKGQVTYDATN